MYLSYNSFICKRQVFVKPDGSMYQVDEILKRPRLANTLETIANEGADTFYTGSLAQDVVNDINDHGITLFNNDIHKGLIFIL